jgi:hypothetical protein
VEAARFPQHDVQDDVVKLAIVFVTVMVPILGPKMDLDVARAFGLVADLQCRMPKIGAGLQIPPALEHHADGAAIGRLQRDGVQALVVPDALHEAFADRDGDVIAVGVAQDDGRKNTRKTPTHEFVAQFAVASQCHRVPLRTMLEYTPAKRKCEPDFPPASVVCGSTSCSHRRIAHDK